MRVTRYVCHSRRVWMIAKKYGWLPGARYTNLRDVRDADRLGFLDIDWKDYSFKRHMEAARATQPMLTVACDIVDIGRLDQTLDQAYELLECSDSVVVVPKDLRMTDGLCELIPDCFLIGYSVPTRYAGTEIPLSAFDGRPVHLLGGRPDHQRFLARDLNVKSIDTNRFTLDATYGDYFDGKTFRRHPSGGYQRCLEDSLRNINALWLDYH